ncbi:hypothetical protein BX589_112252 [Paraburkholderia fungorum]|nr:hypothetical protein BX589_112252 [Paraburkholderia fungorum]
MYLTTLERYIEAGSLPKLASAILHSLALRSRAGDSRGRFARVVAGHGCCKGGVAMRRCGQLTRPLQWLTVTANGYTYHGSIHPTRYGPDMNYPYDVLTAACLFIIVVSTSIMLALS